jgi:predicted neutral ceramidase superfamily lipid hydrolase
MFDFFATLFATMFTVMFLQMLQTRIKSKLQILLTMLPIMTAIPLLMALQVGVYSPFIIFLGLVVYLRIMPHLKSDDGIKKYGINIFLIVTTPIITLTQPTGITVTFILGVVLAIQYVSFSKLRTWLT